MPVGIAGMPTAPLWWHPRGSARLARQRVNDWFAEASCRTPIFRRHRQGARSTRSEPRFKALLAKFMDDSP